MQVKIVFHWYFFASSGLLTKFYAEIIDIEPELVILFFFRFHKTSIHISFQLFLIIILAVTFCAHASLFGHSLGNAPPKTNPKVKIVKIIDGRTINTGHDHSAPPPEIVKIVKVQGGTAPSNNGQAWPNTNCGTGPPASIEILKIIDGGTFNSDSGNNVYGTNEPNVQVIKIIKQTKPGGNGWHNSNKNNGG